MFIQSYFPKYTRERIFKDFQINSEETLLYAIWLDSENCGFVFTEKRFYWNIKTSIFRGNNVTEIKIPSNILRKNSHNLKVKTYTKNVSKAELEKLKKNEQPVFLVMQSPIGNIRFDTGPLTYEEALALRKIFITYIKTGHLPAEYAKGHFAEKLKILSAACKDFISARKKVEKVEEIEGKEEIQVAEQEVAISSPEAEAEEKAEAEPVSQENDSDLKTGEPVYQDVDPSDYTHKKTRFIRSLPEAVLLNAADTLASLLYVTAAIFAVKPVLLAKFVSIPLNAAGIFFASLGRIFFLNDSYALKKLSELEIRNEFINILIDKKNSLFAIFLILYIIARLTVIALNRESRKGQSCALTLLLVLLCFLMPIKFLIFAVLAFMGYLTMQFAQGFYLPLLGYKAFLLFLISTVEYYMLHLFLYPGFQDIIASVVQVLRLPASW